MTVTDYDDRRTTWSDIQEHLPLLRARANVPRVKVIELGVREGNSTSAFLTAALDNGGHVWSVDIAEPRVPAHWYELDCWTLTVADDLAVVDQAPTGVDVLFIDTSHHYEHTLAELRAYVSKVKPGGVVLCHDTDLEAMPDQPDGDPPFAVARALDAYCAETGLRWRNHPGSYGLGEVRIPKRQRG